MISSQEKLHHELRIGDCINGFPVIKMGDSVYTTKGGGKFARTGRLGRYKKIGTVTRDGKLIYVSRWGGKR